MNALTCRFCGEPLSQQFADLGMSPLSNSFLRPEDLAKEEHLYPLTAYVCGNCFLVQLPQVEMPEAIFTDYIYFSSFSDSWLAHARDYCTEMTERFALGPSSQVIEIASNDGYLLQYFHAAGIPVLGVEPAANVAEAAQRKGIETRVEFFGAAMAQTLPPADLLLGNNVLAHVPDINDFVEGMAMALKPDGVITMEFPHLMRLMEGNQFDTIYHEHFSYLSLLTVRRIFAAHGLTIFDVDELPTHGGSLRIYARHGGAAGAAVDALEQREHAFGLDRLETYASFAGQVRATKAALLRFLTDAKRSGKRVAGYGAPAKANTLLNYCGVGTDLLEFTVDRSPHKQGRFLPGTHIPIYAPSKIAEARPDYVLILPWNLRDEITQQMAHIHEWGGRFVVPIPTVQVLDA
jgi:SAM-dependent methyltransferase